MGTDVGMESPVPAEAGVGPGLVCVLARSLAFKTRRQMLASV